MPPPPVPPVPAHAPIPPSPGGHGDIWQTIGRFQLIGQAYDVIRGAIPSFDHSIQVAVTGGPNADIRRVWYLCVSALYGRFRNRVRTAFCPVSIDVTWDISGKAVAAELNYSANALSNFSSDDPSKSFADPGAFGAALLARGPEQLTIGGNWNDVFNPLVTRIVTRPPAGPPTRPSWVARLTSTGCIGRDGDGGAVALYSIQRVGFDTGQPPPINVLAELPVGGTVRTNGPGGLGTVLFAAEYPYTIHYTVFGAGFPGPRSATNDGQALPRLPDQGRVITTAEKRDPRVQPPKPPVDGTTRGSLLALIAAELQSPCFLPAAPPCTKNPSASSGLFVQDPNAPTSADPIDMARLWSGRSSFNGTWPLLPGQGPDGYPLGPVNGIGDIINTPNPQITNYGG